MVNSGWGKIVRDLRQGLSQDERYAVADHVVSQLEERGDPLGPRRGSKGPDADRPPRVPFSPFSNAWGISGPAFRFLSEPRTSKWEAPVQRWGFSFRWRPIKCLASGRRL